ncbi:MAG TPA: DinB family protein [Gemmatimonadales bacterium]|nr:DinB family protein [Gemmatimonadales bacterium]
MHPQLEPIADEYRCAQARLDALVRRTPSERWNRRSDPERWSVGECVAHLNLTSREYLPLLRDAIARARALEQRSVARYRRDPIGWLLWKSMGPPVRVRLHTIPRFVPEGTVGAGVLVAEFERLQAAQLDCLAQADGLPLTQVRITSPFNSRVRYNLYSCFSILPRHQHRHLWQAERVWGGVVF